ncbi:hypothetical protein QYE76_030178 [Lolium multiflorum]|uniref:BTB domain-containing protein n=1 Tax=Lolium multiflorum TaxID=4521 RepID=A0AAD8QQB5_LOLMU|nr:hypothetical protein QYE76_030178 [Lolium multiflorum]
MGRTTRVKAIIEAFLMDKDGEPCTKATSRARVHEFPIDGESNDDDVDWGWSQFVKGTTLEKDYVREGHITFVCGIMVIHDNPILVPPSDLGIHLGSLLDHMDGTDVSFTIDGETFRAHRAVLAARSPELKSKCIDFLAVEENFKEAAFSDGYALLVLKFPTITAELRKRVRTENA